MWPNPQFSRNAVLRSLFLLTTVYKIKDVWFIFKKNDLSLKNPRFRYIYTQSVFKYFTKIVCNSSKRTLDRKYQIFLTGKQFVSGIESVINVNYS